MFNKIINWKSLIVFVVILCMTFSFSAVAVFADDDEFHNSYDTERSFENAGVVSVGVEEKIVFGDSFETYYTTDVSEGRYRLYIFGNYENDFNEYFWVGIYASEDEAVKMENVINSETGQVNGDNGQPDYMEFEFKEGKYYIVVDAFYSDNHDISLRLVPLNEYGDEIYLDDDEGDAPDDESDMDVPISNWLTDAEITGFKKSKTYTGKTVKQDLTIKIGTTQGYDRTLVAGEDYKITYKNAKNVGKATMTITGLEHFQNSPKIKKTFNIVPKGTSISGLSSKRTGSKASVTLKWKKQSLKMSKNRITGYQIIRATNKKFTKNTKTYTFKGYKKISTTLKNLSRKKTYYFKVRTYMVVDGTTYYSNWSKAKSIKTK